MNKNSVKRLLNFVFSLAIILSLPLIVFVSNNNLEELKNKDKQSCDTLIQSLTNERDQLKAALDSCGKRTYNPKVDIVVKKHDWDSLTYRIIEFYYDMVFDTVVSKQLVDSLLKGNKIVPKTGGMGSVQPPSNQFKKVELVQGETSDKLKAKSKFFQKVQVTVNYIYGNAAEISIADLRTKQIYHDTLVIGRPFKEQNSFYELEINLDSVSGKTVFLSGFIKDFKR